MENGIKPKHKKINSPVFGVESENLEENHR